MPIHIPILFVYIYLYYAYTYTYFICLHISTYIYLIHIPILSLYLYCIGMVYYLKLRGVIKWGTNYCLLMNNMRKRGREWPVIVK